MIGDTFKIWLFILNLVCDWGTEFYSELATGTYLDSIQGPQLHCGFAYSPRLAVFYFIFNQVLCQVEGRKELIVDKYS